MKIYDGDDKISDYLLSHGKILFIATWIGIKTEIIKEIEKKDKKNTILIDTELYPIITNKFEIKLLPTLVLMQNGIEFERYLGNYILEQF
jgi:hypothetical protein